MGGGPGIRVQQFGGGRPRRRPHNHAQGPGQEQSVAQAFQSLLPLLLLFLLPLLSSLFSGLGGSSNGPSYRFDKISPYTQPHTSDRLKVPYWVDPAQTRDFSTRNWRDLDRAAEQRYVGDLSVRCERERAERDRVAQEAMGFFWTDQVALDRARAMRLEACTRLQELGRR